MFSNLDESIIIMCTILTCHCNTQILSLVSVLILDFTLGHVKHMTPSSILNYMLPRLAETRTRCPGRRREDHVPAMRRSATHLAQLPPRTCLLAEGTPGEAAVVLGSSLNGNSQELFIYL